MDSGCLNVCLSLQTAEYINTRKSLRVDKIQRYNMEEEESERNVYREEDEEKGKRDKEREEDMLKGKDA